MPSTGGPEVATGWRRGLPIVDVLRTYERSWIVKDLTAGTVLVALLAPAGTRRVRVAVHVGRCDRLRTSSADRPFRGDRPMAFGEMLSTGSA